ncbi:LysE family translocator [Halomarina ordinaria]|uniref:LysE family translocator n=1 Tax=Halomarina ordinaria TaxID=3033939 RepID=A0ABD5UA58_9EURY|nr:LysE family translocator [Halomarina sp. PSRA2]
MGVVVTFLAGVVFGLALAAPPGPMNAIIAEESVVRGWGAGFRAGLGAMVADLCFLVAALFGLVAFVERYPLLRAAMVAVGGVLMLYFAYGAAREVRGRFRAADGAGKGFQKAFVLALTNPYQILFWLTAGVALLDPGTQDVLEPLSTALAGLLVVRTGSPALLVGLFGGIVVWITGFPAALTVAERRIESLTPVVAGLSALALAAFGCYFLLDAGSTLVTAVSTPVGWG